MLYGALIGAIVGLLFYAIRRWSGQSGSVFVIAIKDGSPRMSSGKVSASFLMELAEVLTRYDVREGKITGIRRNSGVSLQFSKSIPVGCWQSIRNVWSYHAR